MAKLTTIEGIGPALEAKLQAAGLNSIEGLLKVCCTAGGRKDISAKTSIEEKKTNKQYLPETKKYEHE